MTINEVENQIISDLDELSDVMSQYSYLIECSTLLQEYPQKYLNEEYRVKDCQVNTWVYTDLGEDRIIVFAESESLIIKGALSLIVELYNGRTKEELRNFTCTMIDYYGFYSHFTKEQLQSIKNIIMQINLSLLTNK